MSSTPPVGGDGGSPWRCPRCRSTLADGGERLTCDGCDHVYACVGGIPDFRLDEPAWVDFEEDRRRALDILDRTASTDVEGAVELVLRRREEWDEAMVRRRLRQILAAPEAFRADLDGWLSPLRHTGGLLVDIGCGPGAFLAAAAASGRRGAGLDVSLEWLVVAQRMIRAAGGEPVLACALAEALPLADASVSSVALLDVIEHVGDPSSTLREANRVLAREGVLALATPNRFSLSAEPHVGIWGVGWLPARFQQRYVRWRGGGSYAFVRLLSRRRLARLFRDHTEISADVRPAAVSAHELRTLARRRRLLASAYNRLVSRPLTRSLISPVSPFFHVLGRRR